MSTTKNPAISNENGAPSAKMITTMIEAIPDKYVDQNGDDLNWCGTDHWDDVQKRLFLKVIGKIGTWGKHELPT